MHAFRLIGLLMIAAVAMGATPVFALDETVEVLKLDYQEWEPGGDPYASRALITPQFMRLDYGVDGEGFILFDREAGMVYSVQVEDRRILEVAALADDAAGIGEPPIPLVLAQSSEADDNAPSLGGRQPVITEFTVNGELCQQTVSIAGLLPEAVAAWREFALLMAAQRATTLHNTPPEFWQACSLANEIYAPTRYLQQGLPIRAYSGSGISRELRSFEPGVSMSAALFELPEGYQRFRIGGPGQ